MSDRTQKRVGHGGKEKWEMGEGEIRREMGMVASYIDGM